MKLKELAKTWSNQISDNALSFDVHQTLYYSLLVEMNYAAVAVVCSMTATFVSNNRKSGCPEEFETKREAETDSNQTNTCRSQKRVDNESEKERKNKHK